MNPNDAPVQRSRRDFLKMMGLSALTVAMTQAVDTAYAEGVSPEDEGERVGWLIDLTRCVDCGSCSRACKEENNLPPSPSEPREWTFDTWTYINNAEVPTSVGESAVYSVKRQCMHCLDPACVSACPVAAMNQLADGSVVYDVSRCIGCRYCMLACPYDVPRFEWDEGLTPVVGKCILCTDRREQGLNPACVDACPTGTLDFGTRERMLAVAKARIKADPDRYVPHIYGEHEVGGSAVLYLSPVPFEELGFRTDLPTDPLPELTWNIMTRIPAVAMGMAVAMSGTAFITHRRGEGKAKHREEDAALAAQTADDTQEEA